MELKIRGTTPPSKEGGFKGTKGFFILLKKCLYRRESTQPDACMVKTSKFSAVFTLYRDAGFRQLAENNPPVAVVTNSRIIRKFNL